MKATGIIKNRYTVIFWVLYLICILYMLIFGITVLVKTKHIKKEAEITIGDLQKNSFYRGGNCLDNEDIIFISTSGKKKSSDQSIKYFYGDFQSDSVNNISIAEYCKNVRAAIDSIAKADRFN